MLVTARGDHVVAANGPQAPVVIFTSSDISCEEQSDNKGVTA